jgi:hypothetical protein
MGFNVGHGDVVDSKSSNSVPIQNLQVALIFGVIY